MSTDAAPSTPPATPASGTSGAASQPAPAPAKAAAPATGTAGAPAQPAPTPPPALDPKITALRDEVQGILGPLATFELQGKLPAFRVQPGDLREACRKMLAAGYDYLLLMTAADYLAEKRFELVYVLSNYRNAPEVALVANIPRETPEIDTVCDLWPTADWHERETYDLFGIKFRNHPDLRRILLDDTWEGHPLRKDYADKKHDVIKRPY